MNIRIGTRRSPLAQAQADRVIAALASGVAQKVLVESEGDKDATTPLHKFDRPGGFTSVLTDAILDRRIDAAVHSLKDLPLQAPDDAPIVAILPRDDSADALLLREAARDEARPLGLRAGSRVGTSAPRRHVQILAADAELIPIDVRGNVGTRIRLLEAGVLDALLIANAVFERLDVALPVGVARQRLGPALFPPAPGQGAIAIQARRDSEASAILAPLDDAPTRQAVSAERELLGLLGGGCGLPLGAHAARHADHWTLHATYAEERWKGGARLKLRRAQVTGTDIATLAEEAKAHLDAPSPAEASSQELRKRLVVTLAADACEAYAPALAQAGWAVLHWEIIRDTPTYAPLPVGASRVAWIAVPSPRAAPSARRAIDAHEGPAPRIAALGPATARALRREDLPVHLVASGGTGASLAGDIARFPTPPGSVLIPQAAHALPDLAAGLARHGFDPIPWVVYVTHVEPGSPPLPPCDALLLTSPSNVEALRGREVSQGVPLFAFGPATEAAMHRLSLRVAGTCTGRNPSDILQVLR